MSSEAALALAMGLVTACVVFVAELVYGEAHNFDLWKYLWLLISLALFAGIASSFITYGFARAFRVRDP